MPAFRSRARAATLAALVSLACFAASAAQFSVSNTRLHLSAERPVETIVLNNQEARPLAFEVQVMRWTQKANGEWELAPTQDLVVHPLILRVPENGEGRLRVGTISPTVVDEHAYRVELKELPDAPTGSGQVRMLTKVSVPVFVDPAKAQSNLTLAVDAMSGGDATLVLGNAGKAYAPPGQATLKVRDGNGRTLHEQTLDTNYVLAGARWPFKAKVPAAACARAASIELTIGEARPITAAVAPGSRRCAP